MRNPAFTDIIGMNQCPVGEERVDKRMSHFCSAIIPAAGNSTRMALDGASKQFLTLLGVPVLLHTLRAFQLAERIQEIVVVSRKQDLPQIQTWVEQLDLHKVTQLTVGGTTRQESVAAGLAVLSGEAGYVAIHDGARPLITPSLIDFAVDDAVKHRASALGVPVKDTVKRVNGQGFVVETPPRETLWAIQTPQVFERPLYERALQEAGGTDYTDDCQLVERLGIPVHICMGDYRNMKITTPEDVGAAQAILEGLQKEESR